MVNGMLSIHRTIIGFRQDESGDWIADFDCGHSQHFRHNPPWINHPWVTTEHGRNDHLGSTVRCGQCSAAERIGDPPEMLEE
jgi:Protein of unknown function (DUF3565)